MPANSTAHSFKEKRIAISRWLLWLAGAPFLLAAAAYAYFVVFSRPMSPDEGYLMITVRSFLSEGALYETVYTQYGPFYYCYEWFIHAVLSVPLTHDATRLLCAAHWLGAAMLLGLAGWRMTGSACAGLLVFTQAVVHLAGLATEPGHPQELVSLLLAAALWFATDSKRETPLLFGLGVITALLAFTKINVGAFFGIAAFLTLRAGTPSRLSRGVWWWAMPALCAVAPLILMRRHLDAAWCRNFSIVVAAAIGASLFIARRTAPVPALDWKHSMRLVSGFLSVAAILAGISFATGTSLHGLADGILLTPLKMSGVTLLPLAAPAGALVNAALALGVALSLGWLGRRRGVVLTLLKSGYATFGLLLWLGNAKAQILWLLPWVWLAGMTMGDESDERKRGRFARPFLSVATAWQALQVYPVAGTQATIATLLLVVSYVVCLADVLRAWAAQPSWHASFTRWPAARIRLIRLLVAVTLLLVFTTRWCPLLTVRAQHASLVPMELPGSRLVRMDAETVGMYRALSGYLRTNCNTFVTYPGINSLHFWSGKPPPTHINGTGWGQMSHAQQAEILQGLRNSSRPLLVVVEAAFKSWSVEGPAPIQPLVRFVRQECRAVARIGRFVVFEVSRPANNPRESESSAVKTFTAGSTMP